MKTTWGEGNGGIDPVEAAMVAGCVATVIDQIFDPGPAPDYTAQDQRTARRKEQMEASVTLHDFDLLYGVCRKCGLCSRDCGGGVVCTPIQGWMHGWDSTCSPLALVKALSLLSSDVLGNPEE